MRIFVFIFAVLPAIVPPLNADLLQLEKGNYPLSSHLEYRRESDVAKGAAEVAGRDFIRNTTPEPLNFGYIRDAVWVRFNVKNTGRYSIWYLRLDSLLDKVTLCYESEGAWHERSIGRFGLFSDREVPHRDLVFRLVLAPYEQRTYYVKLQSRGNVTADLSLMDVETFASKDHNTQFAFGIYFGIMLIMVLYNFFLFVSTRDLTYLWYVCYVLTFSLLHMTINGYFAEYLFPAHLPAPLFFVPLFISVSGLFSILFVRKILELHLRPDSLEKLSRLLVFLFVGSTVAAITMPYPVASQIGMYLTLFAIAAMTYCGIVSLARGQRMAVYFLLGWGFLFVGITAMLMRNLGVLPRNFFTTYAMQIFSAVEVTLFSLALGDRLKHLSRDSQKLQEVRRDLDIARTMQAALLPPVKFTAPGLDIAHRYVPMLEIGGDFIDIRVAADGLSFFIGDVSGHGIAAAMIATTMKLSLDTNTTTPKTPGKRLTWLNGAIERLPDSAYVTASCAHYSLVRGQLALASAGHPPVIIYHAASARCDRHKPKGMPLGIGRVSAEYEEFSVDIGPGDVVLFYTDGILEQGASKGPEFGFERIENEIASNAAKSAQEISDLLLQKLERYSGKKRSEGFDDDVAFIVLKITGGG